MVRKPRRASEEVYPGSHAGGTQRQFGKSGPGRGATTSSVFNVTHPGSKLQPASTIRQTTGGTLASYSWNDPFAGVSPGLQVIPDLLNSEPNAFHQGTLASAHPEDPIVTNYVNTMMDQLHARAAQKGLSITNYNATGTIAASWRTFWSAWMDQYRMLQGMRAMTTMFGYNQACTQVALAINNNLPRIDAQLNKLIAYPMPMGLCDAIMKTHGVFLSGKNGDAPIWATGASGVTIAQQDITANINNWLAAVDTRFLNMIGIPVADLANISRVLNYLWKPRPHPVPNVVVNEQSYHMLLSLAIQWSDGATNDWNAPSLDGVNLPNIPVLIYGDPGTLDPIWTTLFRSVVAYSDNNAAFNKPSAYGTFMLNAPGNVTTGTNLFYYTANNGAFRDQGANDLVSGGAAAATPITIQTATAFDFPWAAQAMQKVATNNQVTQDRRLLAGFERFYISLQELMDNTAKLYTDIFYSGD